MRTKRAGLVIALLCIALLQLAAYLVFRGIESDAETFLQRGREVSSVLERFAQAVREKDFSALQQAYSARFHGTALGLASPGPAQVRAGVRRAIFLPPSGETDRSGALKEWREYLEPFESIEEVRLDLHQLEEWEDSGNLVAIARFELIGRLKEQASSTVDRAYVRWHLGREGTELHLTQSAALRGERQQTASPLFRDATSQAGLQQEGGPPDGDSAQAGQLRFAWIQRLSGSIAVADFDNDYFEDLLAADARQVRLFRNRGRGRFEDVTSSAGLEGLSGVQVALFADYDNDGDKDLFIGRLLRSDQLFRNNGDGTFIEVTGQSGLPSGGCCTTSASWADYDNDGDLDLYVGRYLDPRIDSPRALDSANGLTNRLFRNQGDGTFSDATQAAGLRERGLCLATAWGDADGDGWADLYVANDFGPDAFYRNQGDGTFSDVTLESGLYRYGSSRGVFWADLDNDQRLDLYLSRVRSADAWMASAPTLRGLLLGRLRQRHWRKDIPQFWRVWHDLGDLSLAFDEAAMGNRLWQNRFPEQPQQTEGAVFSFRDVSWDSGANPPGWFFGAAAGDFDLDGFLDIYAAGGWHQELTLEGSLSADPATDPPLQAPQEMGFFDPGYESSLLLAGGIQRNRLLRNNRNGAFNEIGIPAGAALKSAGRGVALADFNNRGRLDIAVRSEGGGLTLLLNSLKGAGNWISILLAGVDSNRDAVGARVTLRVGEAVQTREVSLGQGYASQSSMRLLFGLGEEEMVDEIVVFWPATRKEQRFEQVPANRLLLISEDAESPRRLAPRPPRR
ncbi:MAG: CRTAC1 family protein [Acidobacteriota bacterium]